MVLFMVSILSPSKVHINMVQTADVSHLISVPPGFTGPS
jgi:hypothetical protein